MRKTLFFLVIGFFLAVLPAYGQHNGHGGGGQHNGNGGGHAQNQPKHDNNGRAVQHNDKHNEQTFHQNHETRGYHNAAPRGEYAAHWDGRHFDHEFFESHWGYGHRFYWGHCGWYGPRWGIGSYFWYDGLYFTIIDTIPYDWYDSEIAIVYDPTCDCYFATNPVYPGVRIHVGIRF